MNEISEHPDFFSNIGKIVRFFKHTPDSGLLFCACDNQALVQQINRQILKKTAEAGLDVRELFISSRDRENVLRLFRKSAEGKPDGVIVNNLDELILVSNGAFAKEINFAREILADLAVPFLFWLTSKNISLFANKATDLFIRKDRGVVVFPDLTGVSGLNRLEDSYFSEYQETRDYKTLNVKIELLEKQLRESEAKHYREERIAKDIAADLIALYLEAFLRDEALALFKKYGKYFEQSENIEYVNLTAKLYEDICDWDKALGYYLKSEKIRIEVGNRAGLGKTYNRIGVIYFKKGDWDRALEFCLKSEKINIEVGDRAGLRKTYNSIGVIYSNKGEWDKALEYFLKSEKIILEVGDRAGLGRIYNNIGVIYSNKGDWDKALEYFLKNEKITLEVGDRAGLGITYNNIGIIYSKKGDWDKALEYYLKDEKIILEVGDRTGLANSYGNQALILKAWGKLEEAMELHKKQEELCRQLSDRAGLARSYGNQALILNDWGKLEEAMDLHKKQEELCRQLGDRAGLARSYCGQALILKAWGKLEEAMDLHKKEEEICRQLGDQDGFVNCYWNTGILLREMGRHEMALDKLKAAIQIEEKLKSSRLERFRKYLADYMEELKEQA